MKISFENRFMIAIFGWLLVVTLVWFLPMPFWVCVTSVVVITSLLLLLSASRTWWWPRVPANLPIFLMLHSVSDVVTDVLCANNTIRPLELEHLIIDLKTSGYVFQTATEAAEAPCLRSVAMTFDDGFVDNYTELFPILKRHQVKATCFITNRGSNDAAFLSPKQVREMYESGLVEFGGHTAEHSVLDQLPPVMLERAIQENVQWLTDVLGVAPVSFAYPCGGYNDVVLEQVKAAGYRYAFTMHKRMKPVAKNPLLIHRQIISRGKTPLQNYLLATRGKYKV